MKPKLRIVPAINANGISYLVQKKGFLFWSIDKSAAGRRLLASGFGYSYISNHRSLDSAIKAIKEEYGLHYQLIEYRP